MSAPGYWNYENFWAFIADSAMFRKIRTQKFNGKIESMQQFLAERIK